VALVEVCGLDNFLNKKKEYSAEDELDKICPLPMGVMSDHMQLMVPPYDDPANKLRQFNSDGNGRVKIEFMHGTTTLGFKFNGGVIIAVDSRATGGQYIGTNNCKKIIEINSYLLGTMAGGAADCIYWERVLAKQCRIYELRNRERISVAAASKLLANMVYSYKGMGLSMGVMIAGWDKRGPGLYYVDNDGQRTPGTLFSVGSGSTYAYGILDTEYKPDMTDLEAQELGRRAIFQAGHRDAMSGGMVRVYHIREKGWEKISEQDSKDLYYHYYPEKDVPK